MHDLFILSSVWKGPLENTATKIAWLNFTFCHFLILKNYKCYFAEESFHLLDVYVYQIKTWESMVIITQWQFTHLSPLRTDRNIFKIDFPAQCYSTIFWFPIILLYQNFSGTPGLIYQRSVFHFVTTTVFLKINK